MARKYLKFAAIIAAVIGCSSAYAQINNGGGWTPYYPNGSGGGSGGNNSQPLTQTQINQLMQTLQSALQNDGSGISGSFHNLTASGVTNITNGSTALNVNGDFTWDQVNEGAAKVAPTSLVTIIDGWNSDGPTPNLMTYQRGTATVGTFPVTPPPGYATYLRMSVATAHTFLAGEHSQIKTQLTSTSIGMLNFGTAQAAPLALDYCLQANNVYTFPIKVPLFIDNNNQSGTGFPSSRIFIHDVTLTAPNVWTCGTYIVPGDAVALWGSPTAKIPTSNTVNLPMVAGVAFGSGPDFRTSTPDVWQTGYYMATTQSTDIAAVAGGRLYMTGFHIRPATTPQVPYMPLPQDMEYERIRRYYWKTFINTVAPAQNVGLGTGEYCMSNPAAGGLPSMFIRPDKPMVDQPTVTTYNPLAANANWRDVTASTDIVVTVNPTSNSRVTGVEVKSAAVSTAGDDLCIHAVFDALANK